MEAFRAEFAGPVIEPADPGYAEVRRVWSGVVTSLEWAAARKWAPPSSARPGPFGASFTRMDENRARRVVDALRDRGIDGHLAKVGVDQFGVRVSLHDGREAEWDTDGAAGLEAQVMEDGMLVGYVPEIEGSEDFDDEQVIDAIARTDYRQPVARQRPVAPPPAPPLPREGGVFRRFLDGFRYR